MSNEIDETEDLRRERQAQLNATAAVRIELEGRYGKVWSIEELKQEFDVIGFMAPLVGVQNKVTGKKGSLEFQHSPRFYFNFVAD